MIFITVGTHEQDFTRLFRQIDKLLEERKINDEVFAQVGYTNYKPKNFKYKNMISFEEMDYFMKNSNIIITHGGPGSIFHSLKYGKIPIVVPRNPDFNEHVDNHQILFAKKLENEKKIIGVYEIDNLIDKINEYPNIVKTMGKYNLNNSIFIKEFTNLIDEILDKNRRS